ncbi:hypothetical protein Pcinc_019426 [Petrolisthes cinctipes]|uniref:Uncharacterized protein n=1 Tax=Petrolisthes cinctipes TaxID=88211 RepID=A0AAE1FK69_PETCI|nr:hypothetical protein Pcinc_019426 [Petrolisthes cinctipes]
MAGYGTWGVASRRGGAGGGQVGVASPGLRSTSRQKMITFETRLKMVSCSSLYYPAPYDTTAGGRTVGLDAHLPTSSFHLYRHTIFSGQF